MVVICKACLLQAVYLLLVVTSFCSIKIELHFIWQHISTHHNDDSVQKQRDGEDQRYKHARGVKVLELGKRPARRFTHSSGYWHSIYCKYYKYLQFIAASSFKYSALYTKPTVGKMKEHKRHVSLMQLCIRIHNDPKKIQQLNKNCYKHKSYFQGINKNASLS